MDDSSRAYNRKTVEKTYNALIERLKAIEDKDFLARIDTLIVFGSFVNSKKEKLHDLDIYFTLKLKEKVEYDYELKLRKEAIIKDNRTYLMKRYVDIIDYPRLQLEFYLKNKSPIISLHDEIDEANALRHYHGYIIKDGKFLLDPIFEKGFGD